MTIVQLMMFVQLMYEDKLCEPFQNQIIDIMQQRSRDLRTKTLYVSKFANAYPIDHTDSALFHSVTGAIDKISRALAIHLVAAQHSSKPLNLKVVTSGKVLTQLVNRGYLTELDPIIEQTKYEFFVQQLHLERQKNLGSYVMLVLTYDCNLRCPYCFQNALRDSDSQALSSMTRDLVDIYFNRTLPNFLGSLMSTLHVTLYGGEPFLPQTEAAVRKILEYSKLRKFEISAITNATTIHQNLDYFGPGVGTVSSVQVTLDGPPDLHNKSRIPVNGAPTFLTILENIKLLIERQVKVSIRINTSNVVASKLKELEQLLIAHEITGKKNVSIYTRSIHGIHTHAHDTNSITPYGEWHLVRDMQRQNITALRSPLDRARSDITSLANNPNNMMSRRTNFCMQNRQYSVVLDHVGNAFGCYEEAGYRDRAIGVVSSGGCLEVNERHTKNLSRTVVSHAPCKSCPIGLACGGGCAVAAESESGSIFASHCDSRKQLVAKAVMAEVIRGGSEFYCSGQQPIPDFTPRA
jgi:uncharacterized protein